MSDQFCSTSLTVNNPQGLHLRPAHAFAEAAAKYECSVELVKDTIRADGKSVLSLLTLGASQGVEITLETKGPDANVALETLAELIASGFPAAVEPSE